MRRRRLRWLLASLLLLVGTGVFLKVWLLPRMARRAIQQELASVLEVPFALEDVSVELAGRVSIGGLTIWSDAGRSATFLKVPSGVADVSLRSLFRGRIKVVRFEARGVQARIARRPDGTFPFRDLFRTGAAQVTDLSDLPQLHLPGLSVELEDPSLFLRPLLVEGSLSVLPDPVTAGAILVQGRFPHGLLIEGRYFPAREVFEGSMVEGEFPLGPDVRERLAESFRSAWDWVEPSGRLRLRGRLDLSGERRSGPDYWIEARLEDGGFKVKGFPYPVSRVQGRVEVDPDAIRLLDVRGERAGALVRLTGTIRNYLAGKLRVDLLVDADSVPFDETLKNALRTVGAEYSDIFDALSPRGTGSVRCLLRKAPEERVVKAYLVAEVAGSELTYLGFTDRKGRREGFPYTVYDAHGTFHARGEGAEVSITGRGAAGGRFLVEGGIRAAEKGSEFEFRIEGRDVPLDQHLGAAVAAAGEDSFSALSPRGRVDVDCTVREKLTPDGPTRVDLEARLTQAEVTYREFPLPLREAEGTVRWQSGAVSFEELRGVASGGRVRVNGAPHGPRPLVIEARRMSVTDELLSASTVAFPEFARTLERFRIQGHLDAEYRIDPGSPRPALTVLLSNGTIAYQGLAVPFTDAAARLDSDGARIELTDFRGRLGPGVVRGGSYSGRPGGAAALRLQVDGVDLAHGGQPFGADLDVLNPVWQTLHPAGRANVSVNLDWGDGEAPTAVDVSATLTGAHFQLAELPFAFEETVGTVRWRDGRLDVSEVQARAGHGEVRVRTGWATFLPEGRAGHLELSGRGLPMLETLRPILPAASRKRLEGLHTSGELDVVQFTLGFDLPLNGPGKARGAGLLVFHGVSIQPGLRLSELEGPMVLEQVEVDGDRFEARGRLAGVHLRVGRVDLHDLKADLELKSGTIRFSSPTATLLRGSLCDNPDARQAAYFWARTEPPGEFSGTFGFRDVELGQLLPALDVGGEATEEPLSGRISGSVEFGSRGEDVLGGLEGKGRVMLERGYLGAVPLLVGLLNVFQIPRTADFTGGRIDFQIRDRAVELSTVEIRSRPMDLVGAGRCTFAGELDITLDPRFNLPLVPRVKIPILGELWSALKSEIYYVHVVGEIDDPQTRVVVSPFKIGDDEPGRKSTRPAGRIDRQIPKRF